ncbi:MAG: DUF5711 family protein, partial [Lachnospiraceae bacterium]|nr:DUF5711 family protein [Lachnospiraceae bacterium]
MKGNENDDYEPKPRINYKEQIRSRKLTRFYRIVLLLLLLGGVSLIFYIQWRDRIYSESILTASAEIHIVSGTSIRNLGGYILQYSKDGISLTNNRGQAVWNQTYEMQEPRIAICRNVVAVADYNGSTIYIMDTEQKLGEISTNLPIRAFDVAASGHVLTVLDDGNTTWINLYAADGTHISSNRTSMNDSGYPVSVTVSPNGKLVGVSFFYVADGASRTSIAFYNFGPVGQNANNYMSGYNYANIIAPYLKFMGDDAAFAVSDDRLMFFHGNEKPLSGPQILLEHKVKSIFSSEDYVGLVFHATDGEVMYRLDIYDKTGKFLLSKPFDFEYTDVLFT